jgi:hypothetical protein
MADHPRDITTSYRRQIATPEDAIRARAEAARREELQEGAARGSVPHEAMAAYVEYEADELERLSTQTDAVDGGGIVNAAIVQTHAAAQAAVEAATVDPDVKLAKAIAAELKGHVIETSDADIFVGGEPTDDEQAEMEAYLAEPDEDEVVGTDSEGRTVFRDASGFEYILEDAE